MFNISLCNSSTVSANSSLSAVWKWLRSADSTDKRLDACCLQKKEEEKEEDEEEEERERRELQIQEWWCKTGDIRLV